MSTRESLAFSVTLTTINCGECGGTYAINENYRRQRQEEGKSWTCPYCKVGWGYSGNSDNARLKKELERQTKLAEWERNRANTHAAALKATEHQLRAQKGAKTKLKKRIANGVCPCCDRSFTNLQRHMKHMHPDYVHNE